ncbi:MULTISPECIES: LysR family transcriptional regulator [Rhodococcus erythropolis group]|uniref:LysR family transcriptional regulator n=1 Tax=Rhodococcus erythropolis group TaxID=2840174 RepID=UPI001C9AD579|nr:MULTISPECIES: LysR family transcriptional regulator [Rhodococcus erythropolis group]MBY6382500.1 LysR family transcriptional regulator [Rhodococcus erythropolis]MCW0190942.1 LysR family transcriptional regulator [Rhodococcus sp. (in: high G+C Gram-positive bacteria)]
MNEYVLDPHRLAQFVAVAEHLNITRAAADLHLTQQAVSSTIKVLERELKVTLLKRTGRGIALTPAGARLLAGARPLVDASKSLVRATRAAARDTDEELAIGYTSAITPDEIFDMISRLRKHYPNAAITTRQYLGDEIIEALRSGTVGIGLQRDTTHTDDVDTAMMSFTPLRIAVSSSHRLAHRPSIALSELAAETLMLGESSGSSTYSEFLLSICRGAGFEPTTTISNFRGVEHSAIVIGTDCYTFVTAGSGTYHRGATTVIPLAGTHLAAIQAVWLRHTTSRIRDTLVTDNQAITAFTERHIDVRGREQSSLHEPSSPAHVMPGGRCEIDSRSEVGRSEESHDADVSVYCA